MAIMGITLVVMFLAVAINIKGADLKKSDLEYSIREQNLEQQKEEEEKNVGMNMKMSMRRKSARVQNENERRKRMQRISARNVRNAAGRSFWKILTVGKNIALHFATA